jgi:hypothetical protein
MRLTAAEQAALGVVDRVVPEAGDGAHDAPAETAQRLRASIETELERLSRIAPNDLVEERYARYRRMGEFVTSEEPRSKRRERRRISTRIRSLLSSGRAVLGGNEGFTTPLPVEGLDEAQSAAPLGEEV